MQVSQKSNFPKRMRYYQGMIDLNLIERGADYNVLRKSYIIFICPFDGKSSNMSTGKQKSSHFSGD